MAEKNLANINSDVTWESSLLCSMKGEGQKQGTEGGYDWSALASFKRWIDITTVARMFGGHWTHLTN